MCVCLCVVCVYVWCVCVASWLWLNWGVLECVTVIVVNFRHASWLALYDAPVLSFLQMYSMHFHSDMFFAKEYLHITFPVPLMRTV